MRREGEDAEEEKVRKEMKRGEMDEYGRRGGRNGLDWTGREEEWRGRMEWEGRKGEEEEEK